MSDTLNEQLSALLDGELPPEETELLLKRLERDPALRTVLARYRAVGDALRGDRVRASEAFALRVSRAIAQEAPHAAPAVTAASRRDSAAQVARRGRGRSRWVQSIGGLAVAATVAAVAVVVLQRDPAVGPAVVQMATTSVDPPAASGVAAMPVAVPALAPQPTAPAAVFSIAPAAQLTGLALGGAEPFSYVTPPAQSGALGPVGTIPTARLTNYLVAHSEFSSPLGRLNVLTGLVVEQAPAARAR